MKPYILVAPLVIFLGLTFVFGLGSGVLQSFGAGFEPLTLRHYHQVLWESDFVESLSLTIYVALTATVISNVLGVIVAFAMLGLKRLPKWQRLLYQVPIVIPHLVVVILVFHIFSQTGVLSRLAWWVGLVQYPGDFPLLVFDHWGIGIMLVYIYKQVPFVTMIVSGTLGNISSRFHDVAANLGASKLQIFTQVLLPLLWPTILSVFLITFSFGFGAFEVPFLIGTPAWNMLPVKAYFYYINIDLTYRAPAMVINVLIAIISISCAWLYERTLARARLAERGGDSWFEEN